MLSPVFDRLRFWKAVFSGTVWKFLVLVPTTLLSGLAFWRDELLSPERAAKLKMLQLLPSWPWYYWALATAVVLIILIGEGAYRENRKLRTAKSVEQSHDAILAAHTEEMRLTRLAHERENDPIEMALRSAFAPKQHVIVEHLTRQQTKLGQIIIGTGAPFETIEPCGVNRRRHVRVKLQNNTDLEISNGRLELGNLDPPNNGTTALLLKREIGIGAKSDRFEDIAYYDMGASEAKPGTNICLAIPAAPGGFLVGDYYSRARLPLREHTFYLRLMRFNELYDEVFCRLYFDSPGLLCLQDWSDSADRNRAQLGSESDRINAIEAFLWVIEKSKWAEQKRSAPDLLPSSERYETALSEEERLSARLMTALDRDLHDRLSLGELHAWGRLEHDRAIVPIPQNEWQTDLAISFDKRGLESKSENACAWTKVPDFRNNRVRYVRVQLSRREMAAAYG